MAAACRSRSRSRARRCRGRTRRGRRPCPGSPAPILAGQQARVRSRRGCRRPMPRKTERRQGRTGGREGSRTHAPRARCGGAPSPRAPGARRPRAPPSPSRGGGGTRGARCGRSAARPGCPRGPAQAQPQRQSTVEVKKRETAGRISGRAGGKQQRQRERKRRNTHPMQEILAGTARRLVVGARRAAVRWGRGSGRMAPRRETEVAISCGAELGVEQRASREVRYPLQYKQN